MNTATAGRELVYLFKAFNEQQLISSLPADVISEYKGGPMIQPSGEDNSLPRQYRAARHFSAGGLGAGMD